MFSSLLSITKEQSLGEAGQSEKWGQGHSEAQVRRQIYYTGGKHSGLRLETCFIGCDAVFSSDGLKASTGTGFVKAH